MPPLFHPVRLLLSRFHRPWVVVACGLLILALLAGLAQGVFSRILGQMDANKREIAGLAGVTRIRAVLQPLQEHRGLDNAIFHGDSTLVARHAASEARVDAAFTALLAQQTLAPEHAAEATQTQAEWHKLRESIGDLDRFEQHSALIDRLLELARRVIDDSGLSLDADAGTYHLVGVLDVMLGFTLERAAQLRGLYAALLASGGGDPHLRGELVVCATALDDERKLVSHHVSTLLRYRPDLAAELGDLPTRLEQSTRSLRRLVREHAVAPGSELSTETFFEQASVAIGGGYALFDRTLALAERSLRTRQEQLKHQLGWHIAGILALTLAIVYLFIGMVVSVRASRRAGAELLLAARVFEHAGEAIMVTDADNRIVKVNPAFTAITGYAAAEVLGQTPARFKSGRHDAAFYQAMWRTLSETGAWEGEIWDRRRDGVIYPKWLTISAIRDQQGEPRHYVALFTDISERKQHEEHIRHLAEHDSLTGLPNRALLQDRLIQTMARAERAGSRLALLYIDLDRFKLVNDTLGHSVGDALLQEVAHRLRATVRVSDTVSRQGGDEFLVLLDEIESADDAARVAQKMLDLLAQPCRVASHELTVTPSIGISLYPDDSTDMITLIKSADIAMYQAKEGGRNAYQFYTGDMNERASERLTLEHDLRRALERGELLLHYQPQIELASGRIVGLEALLRWRHPERGLVLPGRFIAIAEDSGLIVPIGEGVLHEACRQSLAWQAAGLPAMPIAVNLSAVQFRRAGLEGNLRDILAATGLPPHLLELELTESIVMNHAEETVAILARLHELGVRLSIDDFGTGYSSLAYLKRFPIQKIKVDQSFIHDVTRDANDAAIVRGIIGLAHSLGIGVIAEGVETREQFDFLRELGCEQAQGCYCSPPLAPTEIEALLRAGGLHQESR